MGLDYIIKLLGNEWNVLFTGIGAVLARVGPIIWLVPFLGGKLVPPLIKTSLALMLSIILAPHITSPQIVHFPPMMLGIILLKESLVGLALGLVTGMMFWAAEAGGRLIDTARGANLAEIMVPQLGIRSSPLGELYFQLAIVLFISLGGLRIFLSALGISYQILPLTEFPSMHGLGQFAFYAIRLSADLFTLGLALAAPVLATLFISEVILGLVHRFVPQMNVFFLAMPAKAILSILALMLVIGSVVRFLPLILDTILPNFQKAIHLLR